MSKASQIRQHIKHIPGAWVRCYRDGSVWAGARTRSLSEDVAMTLKEVGFECLMKDEPFTSGSNIVEIINA